MRQRVGANRPEVRQGRQVCRCGNRAFDIFVDGRCDPVIHPDRMQDHRAESPYTGTAGQRDNRDALPQRFDGRGAGIVRERIERDIHQLVGGPGRQSRRGGDHIQPGSLDAVAGEARGDQVTERCLMEWPAVQHEM